MVRAEFQRRTIGRTLTKLYNGIADDAGAATFVRARKTSMPMFRAEGFEILDRMDIDYDKYDIPNPEGLDVSLYSMRRPVGGLKEGSELP